MTEKDVEDVQQGLEAVHITGSEVQRLQEKQRAAVQRAGRERPQAEDDALGSPIHPDLHDLSFGELGAEQRYVGPVVLQFFALNHYHSNLQPPIRPHMRSSHEEREWSHGSLSDFSDYESSDEERRQFGGQSSGSQVRKPYVNVSDDDEDEEGAKRHIVEEDPFADPFGD